MLLWWTRTNKNENVMVVEKMDIFKGTANMEVKPKVEDNHLEGDEEQEATIIEAEATIFEDSKVIVLMRNMKVKGKKPMHGYQ